MKKKLIIIIGIIIILVTSLFIFLSNRYTEDEKKFKKEYSSINIPSDNDVEYLTVEEVIEKLQNGSSIIYFGFPECPWCQNLVPVLLEVNKEYGTPLYYYNALKIRDKKHLDDNNHIIIDKKGTKEYKKIVEILSEYLTPYEGLNDESIKRLYFPTVVFIDEGKIVDIHIGTLDSQKNPKKQLTRKQREELIETLEKKYDKVVSEACEKDSPC